MKKIWLFVGLIVIVIFLILILYYFYPASLESILGKEATINLGEIVSSAGNPPPALP
ncbi:MAG: hypothetical protein KJ906_04495 [Nanoarchaeota archaeon]|nr:hypothetical protein [Nanoarchaeota archaeon]